MLKKAEFSPCRQYRYTLTRCWDENKPKVLFVGLNPSTADENKDDPTITRCIGFAKSWGYGNLCMANLFALRATDPEVMKTHPEPIGEDNNFWLYMVDAEADMTVVAWGNDGNHLDRATNVLRTQLGIVHSLRNNKTGHPAHPLYLPKTLVPELYTPTYEQ